MCCAWSLGLVVGPKTYMCVVKCLCVLNNIRNGCSVEIGLFQECNFFDFWRFFFRFLNFRSFLEYKIIPKEMDLKFEKMKN